MGTGAIMATGMLFAAIAYSAKPDAILQDKTTRRAITLPDGTPLAAYSRRIARTEKSPDEQKRRTKTLGEVFTPRFICEKMTAFIEDDWRTTHPDAGWQDWIDARVLEITCGEAPFIVTPYDAATGDKIPLAGRCGILDRKLRTVAANTQGVEEYLEWALRAVESCYGYEYSADSLVLARMNVFFAWREAFEAKFGREPGRKETAGVVNVIVWNFWQMDGLTGCTRNAGERFVGNIADPDRPPEPEFLPCRIFNWRTRKSVVYNDIKKGNTMKFDYVIGNPPYQEETDSDSTRMPPIYNKFMDGAYEVSDKVELITPARFLFNGGYTPKIWNRKMLDDEHLTVLDYEQKSDKIFANTDIKGGIAITYRDATKTLGPIGTFTVFSELNSILQKVRAKGGEALPRIMYPALSFKLSPKVREDYPESLDRLRTSCFTTLREIFHEAKPDDGYDYVLFHGLIENKRTTRWVRRDYLLDRNKLLDVYKVLLPKSNGSGAIGEVLSTPLCGEPLCGFTQTFIAIGRFDNREEAENCMKYVKTKFARAMLGILKVTQDNPPDKWAYVPLQDFTAASDIDWSQEIEEIDRALYKKYGLDEKEIAFIEEKVRAMK